MVLGEVRRVVEMLLLSHVGVDVLRFDLEKEAVRVGVDVLAAFAVLLFQVVVVEVVHENL